MTSRTHRPAIRRPRARRRAAAARAALVAAVVLIACGGEPERPGAPVPPPGADASARLLSFWRVRDAASGAALDVVGSVAVRDTTWLRFDPVVERAFEAADALVLPNSAALAKQNALMGWKGHLAEGDALANWLPPDVHAAYTRAIGAGGFPPGTAEVTAPWLAARIVQRADWRRTGFVGPSELETYFVHRAEHGPPAAPKEIVPLEESAATYDRYVALPRELQAQLMQVALRRSATAADALPAIQRAWERGDADELAARFDAVYREDPGLEPVRRATTHAEAARLASELRRLLADAPAGRSFFAVVPARDLVGRDGVLARLAKAGLDVAQLAPADGRGTLAAPPTDAVPGLPEPDPPVGERRRVLVVGIDGATMRVAGPLLEAGRLPMLATLAADGASGPLRSHRPIYSPRIWNSIATGKTPAHHGIDGFTYEDENGQQQLFMSFHRKAHALWNIASDAGLSVGVVNWWNTYPPEKVRGVMVSDHAKPTRLDELKRLTGADTTESYGGTVYPAEWSARVAAVFADRRPTRAVEDPFLGNVGIPPFMHREELSKRYYDDDAVARIATQVDEALAPDVLMVFLPGIDRVSHRLWGALEPGDLYSESLQLTPSQRAAARAALLRYYEYTDELVASLARRFGPDDLVLVLSDHGFEAGEHLGDLTGVHDGEEAIDGVLFARGPGIAAGSDTRGTSVDDVTPTVLAWLGLPLGRDMDGRPAAFLDPPVEQPTAIATWDGGEIERVDSAASGSEAEILEQLRALGYIE